MRRRWSIGAVLVLLLAIGCGGRSNGDSMPRGDSGSEYGGPYDYGAQSGTSVPIPAAASPSAPGVLNPVPGAAASTAIPTVAEGGTVEIAVVNVGLQPAEITVAAGTLVVWRNASPATHTEAAKNRAFESELVEPGGSCSITIREPGIDDECSLHPEMMGRIIVRRGMGYACPAVEERGEDARMYCPSCGTEQPPGSVCLACGRSFRRQPELPRGPRPVRRYQRRGVSGRLLGCTATLVVGLVVVLAATAFLTREPARAPVEDERTRSGVVAVPAPTMPSGREASPTAGNRTVRVTEEELDRWLADHAAELRPASDPQAVIDADGIALHVRIYGLGATYRVRPVVRDGRLVLEDGRIEGPLGLGMSAESVTARLQAALDERLAREGLRPVAIELQPGVMTVAFEPVEG